MKGLPDPVNSVETGDRNEVTQLGEGQKITVVAWALKVNRGGKEACNCELGGVADMDNHIVLVDPGTKHPTVEKDECRSVTAEFTPRVRQDHKNFTRTKLNNLIAPTGKLLVRVTGLLMFDSYHFFIQVNRRYGTPIGRYIRF